MYQGSRYLTRDPWYMISAREAVTEGRHMGHLLISRGSGQTQP
jgi:hypothetical protein